MEITNGQAVSLIAAAGLAVGLYHGIGAAIDLGIKLKCPEIATQAPPKKESPMPGGTRR